MGQWITCPWKRAITPSLIGPQKAHEPLFRCLGLVQPGALLRVGMGGADLRASSSCRVKPGKFTKVFFTKTEMGGYEHHFVPSCNCLTMLAFYLTHPVSF